MRIAIVSTPRSGNTWLRLILGSLYGCDTNAVHTPDALDWHALPENFVLQLHWHKTPEFLDRLEKHDFRVVTIARHPLDVLVSILHFAPREPQTSQWLGGEGGNEEAICKCAPTTPEFAAYSTSARARALLSVAPEWWAHPPAGRIRYEDLVAAPETALRALLSGFPSPTAAIGTTLRKLTIENLRETSRNQHYWQGRPGLWRTLLPAPVANTIAAEHSAVFKALGYRCDPDAALGVEAAQENWRRIDS